MAFLERIVKSKRRSATAWGWFDPITNVGILCQGPIPPGSRSVDLIETPIEEKGLTATALT
jgi:hypothetical protein